VNAAALAPSDVSSASVDSSSGALRAAIATDAPVRANSIAIARPIPRPPPVTSATRPARIAPRSVTSASGSDFLEQPSLLHQ
jgi:hypothetical protein